MTTTSSGGQLLTEALEWFFDGDQSTSEVVNLIDRYRRYCKWKPCASAVIIKKKFVYPDCNLKFSTGIKSFLKEYLLLNS